jgi:hypothetical protein
MSQTCLPCPAGKYCPASTTNDSLGTAVTDKLHPTAIICPAGYYCATGTEDYLSFPCPVNTYNPFQGGNSVSSCYQCVEGYECNTPALAAYPTTLCTAGYYCASDRAGRTECPVGTFCPTGTSHPTNCPLGTYNDVV